MDQTLVGTNIKAKKVQLKKYSLFSFTGEVTPGGLIDVDCVPSSWIKYDNELCLCVVHYPGPPYTEEDKTLLTELIRIQADALEAWEWYPVELRGHADTYEQGIEKTEVLGTKPYAYSTDSETSARAIAGDMTNIHKHRQNRLSKTVEEILATSEHSASSETEDDSNADYIDGTSSEEASPTINTTSKNQGRAKKVITARKEHGRRNISQPKHVSPTNTRAKRSTPGPSEQSSRPKGAPLHSKLQRRDNPPRNDSTSKNILGAVTKQAANLNLVRSGTGLLSEKNAELQNSLSTAPVALQEIVKDIPEDTCLIYLAVKKLTVEVVSIAQELQSLRSSIERSMKSKVEQVSIITFVEKYNFIKLATVADFEVFDERLKHDDGYVKDFKIAMECLLDSDIQRTINAIIKKLFHRFLAMQCTAFRKSKDKFLLKGTQFYDLLFDFVIRFHKGSTGGMVTEKAFYQTLSSCLTNAKDWEGNRKNRIPAVATANAPVGVPANVSVTAPPARFPDLD